MIVGSSGESVQSSWFKGLSVCKMVIQGVSLCKVGSLKGESVQWCVVQGCDSVCMTCVRACSQQEWVCPPCRSHCQFPYKVVGLAVSLCLPTGLNGESLWKMGGPNGECPRVESLSPCMVIQGVSLCQGGYV